METNNGSPASEANLNSVLRRMEIQQAQLQLEVRFKKNMALFKDSNPDLYEVYLNYQPEKIKLAYTDNGYVNLINTDLDDLPVYPENPEAYSQEYVNAYCQSPVPYKISAQAKHVLGERDNAHIQNMNKLIYLINENEEDTKGQKLDPDTNMMIMLGVGLGFQITQLLEQTDIHHLVIIETHKDIFYASLHTLDWTAIYEHFSKPNHSLKYIIGLTPAECYDQLYHFFNRIGLHNAIKPYIFDHLTSEEMKSTAKVFFDRMPGLITSMGYFDDEQTSLAHTVNNYRNGVPILRKHPLIDNQYLSKPAFLVGNGPSLDKAKEFLMQHHGDAVIISCGTATGSLKKMGLKPDFHIELERTRPTIEWLEAGTDAEYRKDITFLALNTVHPDGYALFEQCGMGMKTNDLGSHYFSQHLQKDDYVVTMAHANPTVINTGLAFTLAMGFQEFYLIGVDLGFPNQDQHHSSYSIHYDVKDENVKDLNLTGRNSRGNLNIDANFGGTIETTALFNNTRLSLEALLSLNPGVTCYNTGEGARIDGTVSLKLEEVPTKAFGEDKREFVNMLFKHCFNQDGLKSLGLNKTIAKDFNYAVTLCNKFERVMRQQASTRNEAFQILDDHHKTSLKAGLTKGCEYSYTLMKGSATSYNMALAKCLFTRADETESVRVFNEGRQHYLNYLEHAKWKIQNHLLDNDCQYQGFKDMLNQQNKAQ